MKVSKIHTLAALLSIYLSFCCNPLWAQQEDKPNRGELHLGIESNMGVYLKDDQFNANLSDKNFRNNTFVNVGYDIQNLRFGIQYEVFEPVLLGYPTEFKGHKLTQAFGSYGSNKVEATLGSFYEQFGNGLLFRTYEDRALGINTALTGAALRLRPTDWFSLKAIAGLPRKYMDYIDSRVYGADVEINLGHLVSLGTNLSIGGSWIMRDDHTKLEYDHLTPPRTVNGLSGRVQWSQDWLTLGGEYTYKGANMLHDGSNLAPVGETVLINAGLNFEGFGISSQFRSIKNATFGIDDRTNTEAVFLNYIPSLTKIHKYALLSLYPHSATKELAGGEIGGQVDIFGHIPVGNYSKYPLSININASYFKKLSPQVSNLWDISGDLVFAEIGVELEKRWNKRFKTTLVADWQRKDEFSRLGYGKMLMNTQTIVGDIMYKISPKQSLRMELQHAWSDSNDDQRWAMALVEYGIAPHWMIYISDMYNYQSAGANVHYYSAGVNFSWHTLRIGCSFGRNREGLQCSGGVCRYVPEYTGFMINISSTDLLNILF